MIPEQREALDEIVVKMRVGRMKRRTFLERALTIGLSSSAAFSLLQACGGGPTGPVTLVWESERNTAAIPVYQKLVAAFNEANKESIHVVYRTGPATTDQFRTNVVTMLRARNASLDILSLDIIWVAEFAGNEWTTPLNDRWTTSERAKYLPGPIQGCSFDNQIWAAPLRTDVGLIYYRKDLIPTPPKTWDEMSNTAQQVQNQKKTTYGYVWEGGQQEGMLCNFVEVLYSYGGFVLDPKDSKKVVINSPQAQQALTKMVSTIGTISPSAVVTYKQDNVLSAWRNGDAAFMRLWPSAYSQSNDPKGSKIVGKFDIHPMLAGGSNTTGHSTLGGWNLAINAFSNADKQAAAWKFIQYMLGADAQKQLAAEASLAASFVSAYDDPDVLKKQPFFGHLKTILQTALPRPVSEFYPDISRAIQQHVHTALTKQVSPAKALSTLQSTLENIVAK